MRTLITLIVLLSIISTAQSQCNGETIVARQFNDTRDTMTLTIVWYEYEIVKQGFDLFYDCIKYIKKEVYAVDFVGTISGHINASYTVPETYYFDDTIQPPVALPIRESVSIDSLLIITIDNDSILVPNLFRGN